MKRILAIRLGAIGDVILASAPLLNLKISFPDAEISLLTRQNLAGLCERMSGVDRVLPFKQHAGLSDLFRMGEFLDIEEYDAVLDLHGNLRSWYLRKHIASSKKIVYPKRRFERTMAVRFDIINPDPPHTIDLYNQTVKNVGGRIFADRPVLRIPGENKLVPENEQSQKTIVISPGASYPNKQWPSERFRELSGLIVNETDCNIALVISGKDSGLHNLNNAFPKERFAAYIDIPLEELAGVISRSFLTICNDSGLMHLSSAVGTPVVALFGPTHPTLGFSPRGLFDAIMQVDEYCRPCSLHGKRKCFREEQYCFTRVSPREVMNGIKSRLESNLAGEKALFLDRDGTLIKEKNFISDPDLVEPIAGSFEALKAAKAAGYKIIVISNQSGVARGHFEETAVRTINQRVIDIYREAGIIIDDILYCPFYHKGSIPEYSIEHRRRKPGPGMVEEAALKHNINPFKSWVIGDKLSDVNLAFVTGGRGILVKTGFGLEEELKLTTNSLKPELVADNIYDAVKYALEQDERS